MYRRGIVSAVDPETCRARVTWPDKGNAESFWLEVLQTNTLDNRDYALPDVGELVAVLMDKRNEAGCILGAIYTDGNKPPSPSEDVRRVTFPDGVAVTYDRASKVLSVSGDATVVIGGGASPVALELPTKAALDALKAAISGAVPNAGDGGAQFKAQLMSALGSFPGDLASQRLSSD